MMKKEVKKFEDYIVESIILNNNFGIVSVNNLEEITTVSFDSSQYTCILKSIKEEDFEAVESLSRTNEDDVGYLTVMKFIDQLDRSYIVTVFDSDEIWQDPQVIDILDK